MSDYPLEPYYDAESSDDLLEAFLDYVDGEELALYPAQEEAILNVFAGEHVILNTPTGSGKSLVAAAVHFHSISLKRRSVYTCPIKALVNEKFLRLCEDFGPDNVGMMTGDASVNRDAPILCCTAEILANIALRDGSDAQVDDVIMDEFHYYSDRERGVAWQVPLLTLPQCRFLLMSATMGATAFFEKEIHRLTGKPCQTVFASERPVPLHFDYSELPLHELLARLQEQSRIPAYLVHFTQRQAAETAQNLLSMNFLSKEEKKIIGSELEAFRFSSPFGKDIKKLLRNGIGLHHAGLLPKYRVLVEQLAQRGLLKVICGTDTLGVGVNVPIRTVVFTQLCKYDGQKTRILPARDFHQISGRAGRKGFDDVGYVYAQAPLHVIENVAIDKKVAKDPKKKKKLQKRRPPERGYVHWDKQTFDRLQVAAPEGLESSFKVSHGMLLNVLGRPGDGCRAMRNIISDCHNTDSSKKQLRHESFQLFRSLLEKEIIEIVPSEARVDRKIRVNVELQDDFSLNQELALYCVDTVMQLDVEDEGYALKLLSVVESILENPDIILRRQVDKLKDELMAEWKAEGLSYEERMERLQSVEHPKPEREFIYNTFNAFSRAHPWVGEENIRPKSIVREMFEHYLSFSDYIRYYQLHRAEGLLLRHISNVYRVLEQTIPDGLKTETVWEMVTYLAEMLRQVDSSLLEEWEKMRDPDYESAQADEELVFSSRNSDIFSDEAAFMRLLRNQIFAFVRLLANRHYEDAVAFMDMSLFLAEAGDEGKWADLYLEKSLEPYFESHEWIRLDPPARNKDNTLIEVSEDKASWLVEQILVDPEELNDWSLRFRLDVEKTREQETPVLAFMGLRAIL